jgi:hypothetical protein
MDVELASCPRSHPVAVPCRQVGIDLSVGTREGGKDNLNVVKVDVVV